MKKKLLTSCLEISNDVKLLFVIETNAGDV